MVTRFDAPLVEKKKVAPQNWGDGVVPGLIDTYALSQILWTDDPVGDILKDMRQV